MHSYLIISSLRNKVLKKNGNLLMFWMLTEKKPENLQPYPSKNHWCGTNYSWFKDDIIL